MTLSPAPPRERGASRQHHIPGEGGAWIFIFGDISIFAMLFATYLRYRSRDPQLYNHSQLALNPVFGAVNTLLLLLSSLLVVVAITALRREVTGIAPVLLVGAIACGLVFSTLKVIEYRHKMAAGITPHTNDFFMFYYTLTGLHWFHLILGLAMLGYLLYASRKPALTAKQFGWVEGGGCFWHMVDLLWIVLFPLLYLVG
jgi:nitric oxide reductase NorE protein